MESVPSMKNHSCDCRLMPNYKSDSIQSQNEFRKYGTCRTRKVSETLQDSDHCNVINQKCYNLSEEHMSASMKYRRSSEEYRSLIHNHPTRTVRRNSISAPQLVEHLNDHKRYPEGMI